MSVRILLCFAVAVLLFAAAARAETIIIDSDTTIRGTMDDTVVILGTLPPERPPVINIIDPAVFTGPFRTAYTSVLNVSGGRFEGRISYLRVSGN